MRFFRRKAAAVSEPVRPDQVDRRSGQRPGPMRDGARFALLDGDEDLEVVGESFYQPSLWQLAGARPGRERVRKEIRAVLSYGAGGTVTGHPVIHRPGVSTAIPR
jgi:hypothetical protein